MGFLEAQIENKVLPLVTKQLLISNWDEFSD